jgi:salicylate hydroxylase
VATNGHDLPILVVGGGIGGLVTAYALALKGFPVRVLEQAPEFKELGAGIQLGPNIFRTLDKIGLKDAVLADAWVPNGMEMRNALTGRLVTRVDLGKAAEERFQQPYAVTHRTDIHEAYLAACRGHNLVSLENNRTVDAVRDDGPNVTVILNSGEEIKGRAVIGCDGLWSKVRETIVGDGPPRVSGHIAYRAVLKREDVPEDLWKEDIILWAGPRTHFVHYPLRRGELYNLVAVFHSDHYEEGWNLEGDASVLMEHFKGERPEVLRLLEKIETWRYWVLCDREPIKDWTKGPHHAPRRCRASDAAVPRARRLHGDRGRGVPGGEGCGAAGRSAGGVPGISAAALSAHRPGADHVARLRRVLSRPRRCGRAARHGAGLADAEGVLRCDRVALQRPVTGCLNCGPQQKVQHHGIEPVP